MRRLLALLAAAAALICLDSPAQARSLVSEEKALEPVASAIAGKPLRVLCYLHDEPDDPWAEGAWAYVYLFEDDIHLSREACDGALALVSGAMVPLWEQELGALALTHEAYHLKVTLPDWRRGSEAQTECRAVKRVEQTMLDLGATRALADALLPWSLAEHFKITSIAPEYDWPGCRVPVFADFWPS
jgi:hypothetical protein